MELLGLAFLLPNSGKLGGFIWDETACEPEGGLRLIGQLPQGPSAESKANDVLARCPLRPPVCTPGGDRACFSVEFCRIGDFDVDLCNAPSQIDGDVLKMNTDMGSGQLQKQNP